MADRDPLTLTCYLHEGWAPVIRPASARREWMDRTPQAFAYRCLPLNIANAHGWEIIAGHGCTAVWNGGAAADDVTVTPDAGTPAHEAPVALFGQGTVTFHVAGLFRTPPGWNLWLSGPPNHAKDGIAPLGGVIETDWAPFTFTMNWRFTRANHPVRFEAGEPVAFFFPVERARLEEVAPEFRPLTDAPDLARQFAAWSAARDAFHARAAEDVPVGGDSWQKHYYRGVDMDDLPGVPDHRAKLRLRAFANPPAEARCPVIHPVPEASAAPPGDESRVALAKRDWLLDVMERQRSLSARAGGVHRFGPMSPEAFLDHIYAPARPAIITGEMADWPASGWTPARLAALVGDAPVQFQAGRASDPDYETRKDAHARVAPFAEFAALAEAGGNDVYLTAYNAAANRAALAPLNREMGTLPAYLDGAAGAGMPWIGGAGTFTPLHHDLTNNLLAQIVGRKRVLMVPAGDVAHLYNDRAVFSRIRDLDAAMADLQRFPLLDGARLFDFVLEPGELLFIPVGWWHQLTALDFSVSATFTNFRWPNDASRDWPC